VLKNHIKTFFAFVAIILVNWKLINNSHHRLLGLKNADCECKWLFLKMIGDNMGNCLPWFGKHNRR